MCGKIETKIDCSGNQVSAAGVDYLTELKVIFMWNQSKRMQ